jgi:glycosyltransferase 2 family protein
MAEGARLGLVVFSLHLVGVHLGPSQFLLIALVAALLTTVPFLPGGLGLVEAGMIGVLITVGGVTNSAAASITLLDRSISYGSLVIVGFVIFVVTHVHVPRAHRVATQG